MFFPFSKQSKVSTQKSSLSNNNHSTSNHFKISLIELSPSYKNDSTKVTKFASSETPEETLPTDNENQMDPTYPCTLKKSNKNDYRNLILLTIGVISAFIGVFFIIRALKNRRKKKLNNSRPYADIPSEYLGGSDVREDV